MRASVCSPRWAMTFRRPEGAPKREGCVDLTDAAGLLAPGAAADPKLAVTAKTFFGGFRDLAPLAQEQASYAPDTVEAKLGRVR